RPTQRIGRESQHDVSFPIDRKEQQQTRCRPELVLIESFRPVATRLGSHEGVGDSSRQRPRERKSEPLDSNVEVHRSIRKFGVRGCTRLFLALLRPQRPLAFTKMFHSQAWRSGRSPVGGRPNRPVSYGTSRSLPLSSSKQTSRPGGQP